MTVERLGEEMSVGEFLDWRALRRIEAEEARPSSAPPFPDRTEPRRKATAQDIMAFTRRHFGG